jgi:hypothetical protein
MNPAVVSAMLTVLILFIAARSLRRRRHPGITLLDCGINCAMVFFIANGGGIAWTSQVSVVLWWLTVALFAAGTACSIFIYLLTLRSD